MTPFMFIMFKSTKVGFSFAIRMRETKIKVGSESESGSENRQQFLKKCVEFARKT